MQQLINWNHESGTFSPQRDYRNRPDLNLDTVAAVVARHPVELADLVDALDAYFRRIGMSRVCGSCFAGELQRETGGVGCCGKCALLGSESCASKPLYCALWMCHYTRRLFPQAEVLTERIRTKLWEARLLNIHELLYSEARVWENSLVLSGEQKRVLREAIRLLAE